MHSRRRKTQPNGRLGPSEEPRFTTADHGDLDSRGGLLKQLTATLAALKRNRAARNRLQAARARHDMRSWQVERRKRTRHLIELGGLVVKAGIVKLTGDDRAMIYGALLWMAEKLKSEDAQRARELWAAKGREAFAAKQPTNSHDGPQSSQNKA